MEHDGYTKTNSLSEQKVRKSGCEPQERCFNMLWTTYKFGIVPTRVYRKLFFNSKFTALHRIKKLVKANYLCQEQRTGLNGRWQENLHSITLKGRKALAEHYQLEVVPQKIRLALSERNHVLELGELRLALVLALRAVTNIRLSSFLSFWELRQKLQCTQGILIPDALVQFEFLPSGEKITWALELDFSTESLAKVKGKIERYQQVFIRQEPFFGNQFFWVGFLAYNQKRLRNISKLLQNGFKRENFFMGKINLLTAENILEQGLVSAIEIDKIPPSQLVYPVSLATIDPLLGSATFADPTLAERPT